MAYPSMAGGGLGCFGERSALQSERHSLHLSTVLLQLHVNFAILDADAAIDDCADIMGRTSLNGRIDVNNMRTSYFPAPTNGSHRRITTSAR
jgi:hypothetical protein